ncbi:Pre-mRNA-processing factor 39 [Tolypocladium ophioglossoides CBS 100239]|uniref:Pre-mRNA-processing factor 39 n=1 Tax=Tolypocladium ophioglossoides (strain CBS 100239) TaxID=1163406 RepID=A0A0L0N8U0_TOLOC|nr:Pre-mRNA-processing factor 39 [Tolypocladium ophioglossoides CBS 100239]
MNDFGQPGGADDEFAAVHRCLAEVDADPDKFENWEKLISACETLEGGLSRNSSPAALAACRDAFDRFLAKFPLYFGFWKKYAEFEFQVAGTESAEMVYERGIACNPHSVDLWAEYCRFKMDTVHDTDVVRDFFEHAATMVGIDYMSHPFWDKYIEFEERSESPARVYAVLARIVRIPLHQFNRYFERFRPMIHELDLEHLAPAEVLERVRTEVQAEAAAYGAPRAELEVQRDIRGKIDSMYLDVHTATQTEVTRVWAYESELGHQFFHTVELSHQQLNGWRKYLDFEEAEGDFARTKCVYERCITVCAFYDDFWFRYARWMSGQGKVEEVRHIYLRAAFFVPISRPGIRMQWTYFEESQGRVDVARDIHEAILMKLPDCIEVIVSWAHLQRRQKDLAAAVQVLRDQIDAPIGDLYTKAALVAEWAMLLWKSSNGSAESARAVFLKNAQWYGDSRNFWEKWFQFELEQRSEGQGEIGHRVRHVFTEFRRTSRLPPAVKRDMAQIYLDFLVHRGGQSSILEYLDVDREMFGPASVAFPAAGQEGARENGAAGGELDEASKKKAESRLVFFYQTHTEPDASAQGPAGFN